VGRNDDCAPVCVDAREPSPQLVSINLRLLLRHLQPLAPGFRQPKQAACKRGVCLLTASLSGHEQAFCWRQAAAAAWQVWQRALSSEAGRDISAYTRSKRKPAANAPATGLRACRNAGRLSLEALNNAKYRSESDFVDRAANWT
jgi:hypothetical protein